jgi:hypothetical protein
LVRGKNKHLEQDTWNLVGNKNEHLE